jgi:hypothetical protein
MSISAMAVNREVAETVEAAPGVRDGLGEHADSADRPARLTT